MKILALNASPKPPAAGERHPAAHTLFTQTNPDITVDTISSARPAASWTTLRS
jgi:hypothetical protein